ncbi:hypothetical protein RJ640_003689 [Escallonia rubra]|uniref:non-specific serine/threonine protein kinase n=1 Tax=Escallonia rubra TaxID=112253 RepID=A0AA88U075_9ASTE|nr:hypothetical protein RJ640_003689 [Escallonia rubra]
MKHLLRKLHIGNDHHRMAASDDEIRPVSAASPPPHAEATGRAGDAVAAAGESSVDFSFFEDEFQMQLALAISVSSDRGGDEDSDEAETAQIRAAKERSLECSPSETLVRYWSNNVINYGEKVMDGFYDVYGTSSNLVTQGKMPLLVDLETVTVSDDVDYEVVLVNRTTDMELQQLEERLCKESLEGQAVEKGLIVNSLIQKIADLVVDKMGGPVSDANEMLKRWTLRRNELRNCLNTIILPLGCLDFGLSRHRALLFKAQKVLADRMNLPCMLVKGSYYTGTDEGAVNLIKFDNGSEYIIDLMGAPGTLIPAEVPSSSLQSSGLDIRFIADFAESSKYSRSMLEKETGPLAVSADLDSIAKTGSLSSEVTSIISISSEGNNRKVVEKNPTEQFEHEFGKLLPSLCRSHEGSSLVGGKSSAQKMQVKDVSKYVISASKNPEFASKLHAVLLESGASPPLDLLSDLNLLDLGEQKVLEQVDMLNGKTVGKGAECYPPSFLSNNEQSLVPFTELQPFNNFHFEIKQRSPEQQKWESAIVNHGHSLPSNTASEGSMFVYGGRNEMVQTNELGLGDIHVERTHESSMFSAASPFDKQPKEFESLMEMENCGQSNACIPHNDKISPALGDVADWEIPWEHLQIGERIGIGSYGEVYRAEWNGTEVAVKKFMDQDISGDALFQFKCEVEIMLRLRHPNVVLFMGAVTRPPHLSILTEFLPRGSLFKLLHRPNVQLDEKRRLRMALDVAKGMNYLHTSHPIIVHRDLKTPNLLVDKNWNVKVCDFGMSRMKHHTFLSSTSTAGTPEWMAPEVLRNERSNEKSDVYSFGVVLWELVTLRIPWTEMNSMQVVGAVGFQHRHLQIPEEVDPMVGRIITDCWNPNPELRPSFGQIISRLRCLKHLVVGRRGTSADQQ